MKRLNTGLNTEYIVMKHRHITPIIHGKKLGGACDVQLKFIEVLSFSLSMPYDNSWSPSARQLNLDNEHRMVHRYEYCKYT